MIDQDEIRQIRRRLREAEEGTTQEKVLARSGYAEDVAALLGALDEGGMAMAIEEINKLEAELKGYRRKEVSDCPPRPLPRMQQTPLHFEPRDGKMEALGKDG